MKNPIIYITLSLLLSACGDPAVNQPTTENDALPHQLELTDNQLATLNIQTDTIKFIAISRELQLNGLVEVPAKNHYSVSVPIGGYLKSTTLIPGMRLTKGALMAELEDPQYVQLQQDFLTSKSRIELLEIEYERQKQLNHTKAASDKAFQTAKTELEMARIEHSSQRAKLRMLNVDTDKLSASHISGTISIYAPFDCFVSEIFVNTGKYITPSEVMFSLIHADGYFLLLTAYEQDIKQLSIGQGIEARQNDDSDRVYLCEISYINYDLGKNGTGEVICQFNGKTDGLLPGMFLNAKVMVKTNSAMTIPTKAILDYEGKRYIFIQTNKNKFEMIEVIVGTQQNDLVSIECAIPLDEKSIVVNDAYALLMSLKNKSE